MVFNPPWTPFEPADPIPALPEDVILVNSRYQVNIRYCGVIPPFGPMAHLSIKRLDKGVIRNWRDMQRIKNEICGEAMEAVEIFPAESRLVDTANQYHLWVFEDYKLPFGFRERIVSEETLDGSVQEPFENPPADLGKRDAEIR